MKLTWRPVDGVWELFVEGQPAAGQKVELVRLRTRDVAFEVDLGCADGSSGGPEVPISYSSGFRPDEGLAEGEQSAG